MLCLPCHILPKRQPVAQRYTQPEVFAIHFPDFSFHKFFHALILPRKRFFIPKLPVHHFRQNCDRIPPTKHIHKTDTRRSGLRHSGAHISFRIIKLPQFQITQKVFPEMIGIKIISACQCINLSVPGISHPFIPLRAISRHFHIIRFLSPHLIFI